jgi:hypothetical protein
MWRGVFSKEKELFGSESDDWAETDVTEGASAEEAEGDEEWAEDAEADPEADASGEQEQQAN